MEKEGRVGNWHKKVIWIEDVIDYFGEYMSEEEGEELLKENMSKSYFKTMNRIRDILLEKGHSVPFRSVYRRTKDEE